MSDVQLECQVFKWLIYWLRLLWAFGTSKKIYTAYWGKALLYCHSKIEADLILYLFEADVIGHSTDI